METQADILLGISRKPMESWFIRLLYGLRRFFRPTWDTGKPATELVRAVAGLPPGKAIEIECGTGTNLLYLAERGWRVTGVDFTPRAIDKAEKKLKPFFPKLMVMNGPLIILDVPRPFDLVLDLSYFNGLYREGRLRYASAVAYWLRPGGRFLLYAWQPVSSKDTRGMAKEEVLQCFETGFRLIRCEQGSGLPSAWYYFERVREGKRKDVHKRRRSSIHTADPRTR